MWTAIVCLSLALYVVDEPIPTSVDEARVVPSVEISEAVMVAIAVLHNPQKVPPEFVQAARKRLAGQDAGALPAIVLAMHDGSPGALSALRSCGDAIVARALTARQEFPRDALSRLAGDRALSGPARRIALTWRERADPGFVTSFLRDRLDDPVFADDAVEVILREASFRLQKKDVAGAQELLRDAFQKTIETEHAQRVAERLRATGESVDLHRQLGTVTEWYFIGPFPRRDGTGATTAFPPESQIDLNAKYAGKSGSVGWQHVKLSADQTVLDLRKLCGDTEDAVAYLAARVTSDKSVDVELRGAANNTLQVWLNGTKVIDVPKDDQQARRDRHRATVTLHPGENMILLKVCDSKRPPGSPLGRPPVWQAGLRIVTANGRGLPLPQAQ